MKRNLCKINSFEEEFEELSIETETEEGGVSENTRRNRRPRYRIRDGRRMVWTPTPLGMCFDPNDDYPEMCTDAPPSVNRHEEKYEKRECRIIEFHIVVQPNTGRL